MVVAVATLAASAGAPIPSSPAFAYPSSTVSLVGHGFGHGHGMGQWGALGYAVAGTDYQQIVGHYYGGTSLSGLPSVPESTPVRVAMTENNGNTVIVTAGSPFSVVGVSGATNVPAVLMSPNGAGAWNIQVGPGCAGPWSGFVAVGVSDPTAAPASDPGIGDPNSSSQALQLCQIGSNITMRGSVEAVYNSDGSSRTVNIVPLEEYVSGVVPNESPAGWGTLGGSGPQGQPWGFQELEAQAVAVRSYVVAGHGSYGGYADTCDLTCQSYHGLLNESPVSDAAVIDTTGQVMELPGGGVAATQYSSSTGGYTNPGAFPAVPDAGDAVCMPGACNPNHTWTTSVPVSTIEADWPQLGTLQSIKITGRNGDGDLGGRVTAMTLVGSGQSVALTGDGFAAAVGLRSDWFAVTDALTSPAVGMAARPGGGGYWVAGSDGEVRAFGGASFLGSAYGLALARPVVGMTPTPDGGGYWLVASDGGIFTFGDAQFHGSTGRTCGSTNRSWAWPRRPTAVATGWWPPTAGIFTFGDAQFHGSTGDLRLNQPVVGMAPTPDGGGYWLVASDGGIFTFGDAQFHGSTGNLRLNQPVVGMAPTPDGGGYWLVASDGGIFTFGDAQFHGSTGGMRLNQPVVGMAPTPDGGGYWLVASDGGIFTFGDAQFYGSAAG